MSQNDLVLSHSAAAVKTDRHDSQESHWQAQKDRAEGQSEVMKRGKFMRQFGIHGDK